MSQKIYAHWNINTKVAETFSVWLCIYNPVNILNTHQWNEAKSDKIADSTYAKYLQPNQIKTAASVFLGASSTLLCSKFSLNLSMHVLYLDRPPSKTFSLQDIFLN
jgi:hypothetical protein